jgi:hypothetical protein
MTDLFRIPPQIHARRFDNEVVIINLSAGQYFALDAVGTMIWDELTGGRTAEQAVATVVAGYQVDEVTARTDVKRLAEELVTAGLLEPHS